MPTIDVVDLVVQAVATLAVGVVDEHVEPGELAEPVLVLVEQREVVLVGIVVDEALHRPIAERAVAQDRERARCPTRALGQLVGRDLALAQRALREVPERSLAPARLVDRGQLHAVDLRLHEEGGVRRVPHAPDDLELGRAERGPQLVGRQFQRGHRCPAGSIGMLAQRARRPAARDGLRPRAAIARTCARVA